jgi:transcriptional repressor NrdR
VSADGVRRRRVCSSCKRRFTTYEKVGSPGLKVEKRDGTLQPFDSEKLHRTLAKVARRRAAIDPDALRRIVRDVDRATRTTRWSDIVRLVLARLAAIDPLVAARLEASYRDDAGRLRLDDDAAETDGTQPQLGLFAPDES